MPDNRDQTDPNIVTPGLLYSALKRQGQETNTSLERITGTLFTHGERLARVETKVDQMAPKVEKACEQASSIKGQWKTMAFIIGAVAVAVASLVIGKLL